MIKGLLYIFLCELIMLFISCNRKGNVECRYYYETGDLYSESYNDYEVQKKQIRNFYQNGNLREICYVKLPDVDNSPCVEVTREYYPDGFPKDCMPLDDDGYSILPKVEDARMGYKLRFDLASDTSVIENGCEYVLFRIYMEGISRIHYDVAIIDTAEKLVSPWKTPAKDSVCVVFNDMGEFERLDTIDERLYPYMMPIDYRFLQKEDNATCSMKLAVYFPTLLSDTTLPNPHQKIIVRGISVRKSRKK